jgi:hypothetical protein
MKATQLLHNLGQSIWLDNITRDLLDSGTFKRYIDELSVTGLTARMCSRGSLPLVSTSIACLLSFKRKEPSRS